MKSLSAAMTAHINGEVTSLATCWHITRTDGVELFITDHDVDVVFDGDTYVAATGIARTAIESSSDMSVDNLDVVGILSGQMEKNELLAGHYDFAEFDIFSVNWVDPDGFGKIPHRFGTIGEIQVKDGSYTGELRGMMQLLERRRGKVWAPDCRAHLFSPLVDIHSGRATGCGLDSSAFEEYGRVESVTDDRQFVVNEFSQETVTPEYGGAAGDAVGVHETDGVVEMVLDIADGTPMRPYVITDKAGLEAMADDLSAHYVLAANIDLGWVDWTPIGSVANPFRGVFDGRGHHCYKVLVNTAGAGPAGFFGVITGTCRRFGIETITIKTNTSDEYAGGIAGYLLGGAPPTPTTYAGAGLIENCWVAGGDVTSNGNRAGGLVGYQGEGTIIRSCWASVVINGVIGADVGALIGNSNGDNRVIDGVTANTDIAGTTDLGNIAGGNANGLLNAEWPIEANWPSPFDLVDELMMHVLPPTAITLSFEKKAGRDEITRSSGNWLDDSNVRVGDHLSFTETVDAGQMNPGESVVIDDVADTFTRSAGSWITDGFIVGQTITVTGSSDNNGSFVIDALSATVLSVVEDITDAEGAQTDLDIDWTADNDITVIVKVMSTTVLFVDEDVESERATACKYSIASAPRSRDPGRL